MFKMVVIAQIVGLFAVGLSMYKNVFSLFPIAGVILHTSAFWITEEKTFVKYLFLDRPFGLYIIYQVRHMDRQ